MPKTVVGEFKPNDPELLLEMAQAGKPLHFTLHFQGSSETGEVIFKIFVDNEPPKRVFLSGTAKQPGAQAGAGG